MRLGPRRLAVPSFCSRSCPAPPDLGSRPRRLPRARADLPAEPAAQLRRRGKMAAMCGILAFFSARGDASAHRDAIAGALECLHHRGPDETGVEVIADRGADAVFAHKRLSIIDVAHSHQPCRTPTAGTVLTFNGEIYNYRQLREELIRDLGATFATQRRHRGARRGATTTGARTRCRRLRGMFAFVTWDDHRTGTLYAARDPFGIKPLYYAGDRGRVSTWPASARRCCRSPRDAGATVDTDDAVALPDAAVRAGADDAAPRTSGGSPPGHRLTCDRGRPAYAIDAVLPAGSAAAAVRAGRWRSTADPRRAPRQRTAHLRADVPVGAFLSSGIDSTAVVALAREVQPGPARVHRRLRRDRLLGDRGRPGHRPSSSAYALTPTVVHDAEMIEALPRIVWHLLDDPVADPSLVPLYFLARTAARARHRGAVRRGRRRAVRRLHDLPRADVAGGVEQLPTACSAACARCPGSSRRASGARASWNAAPPRSRSATTATRGSSGRPRRPS